MGDSYPNTPFGDDFAFALICCSTFTSMDASCWWKSRVDKGTIRGGTLDHCTEALSHSLMGNPPLLGLELGLGLGTELLLVETTSVGACGFEWACHFLGLSVSFSSTAGRDLVPPHVTEWLTLSGSPPCGDSSTPPPPAPPSPSCCCGSG